MDIVVTLICNPAKPVLSYSVVARVLKLLQSECSGVSSTLLAQDIALDLRLLGRIEDRRRLTERVNEGLEGAPIDIIIQPAEGRRKRLLIADMDSTIIEQECLDELADYAGKKAEIAAITERAMRGELNFEAALLERLSMLKGLPEKFLADTFEQRITLTPGAKTLVQTMKKFGGTAALVSGGFTFFTSRVAAAVGFDMHESNDLIIKQGKLVGDVARPIKGREAKEAALLREASRLNIPLTETIAVGDGANDLSMLARAGVGVAFHAKPAVAAAAHARVDHGDLTALLYLQGIPKSDFA